MTALWWLLREILLPGALAGANGVTAGLLWTGRIRPAAWCFLPALGLCVYAVLIVSRLPTLWTNSWFVATVGGAPLAVIKQYVENQKHV